MENEKEDVISPTPPAAKIPSSGRRRACLINSVQVPGRISTTPVAVPTKRKPVADVSSDEIGTFSSAEQTPQELKRKYSTTIHPYMRKKKKKDKKKK